MPTSPATGTSPRGPSAARPEPVIRLIESEAGLAGLAEPWAALWARCPAATPFQSPHWLLPWWRQFGTGQPRVATRWQDGTLTGILPLYVLAAERKALPIGAGTTDYLDGLGELNGLLPVALERLAADPVDGLDLIEVPPWSALRRQEVPGWAAAWGEGSPCPVAPLPALPGPIRRKLRMNRNRAERAGGWQVIDAGAAGLGELVRLHQQRWTGQGEPGVLADPAVLAFWREAMPALAGAGLLRMRLLTVGGTVAAAILALVAPGRIFFYLSGFDDAQAFVSPGTLLLGAMLEEAGAEGRTEAHFLRGQEAYKYAWGGVDRRNYAGRFSPLSSVDST